MKKTMTLLVLAVGSGFFGFSFFKVEERGIMDGILTDKKNPVLREIKSVEGETTFTIPLTFVVDVKKEEWEARSLEFQRRGEEELGGVWMSLFNVPALSVIPDPEREGIDIVTSLPCVPQNGKISPQAFRALERHPTCSDFIWTMGNADEKTYALIQFFPSKGEKEEDIAPKVANLLWKGEAFPWWYFWSIDVTSRWEGIDAAGWIMGRLLIHKALIISGSWMFVLGSLIIFLQFKANFRSWEKAGFAISLIGLSFIWQRGAMGLFGLQESPFTLIAYAAPLLISGPSFFLRAYEEGPKGFGMIGLVALTAAFGFANLLPVVPSLVGFQVAHIVELAWVAMIGILLVYLAATFVFPQFVECGVETFDKGGWWEKKVIHRVLRWLRPPAFWLAGGRKPYWVVGGMVVLALYAGFLLKAGWVVSANESRDFIGGTKMAAILETFNSPGGPGQEAGHYFVKCRSKFHDCLPRIRAWIDQIRQEVPEVMADLSILSGLEDLSRQMLGEEHPGENLLGVVWVSFERDMEPFRSQLWHPNHPGMPEAVSVVFGIRTDTEEELKAVYKKIGNISKAFPELSFAVFNYDALYVEAASYITGGMASNMLTSNLSVFLIVVSVLIVWRWKRPLLTGVMMLSPFLFSLSVYVCILWGAGIGLDIASACIAALLFNAGIDFSLYFARTLVREGGVLERVWDQEAPIILKDGFMNILGNVPMALGTFWALKPVGDLGGGVILVVVLAQLGTLLVMPSLLTLVVPRKEEAVEVTLPPSKQQRVA